MFAFVLYVEDDVLEPDGYPNGYLDTFTVDVCSLVRRLLTSGFHLLAATVVVSSSMRASLWGEWIVSLCVHWLSDAGTAFSTSTVFCAVSGKESFLPDQYRP